MITYGDADEKFIHVYDTAFNFKFSVGNKGKLFSEFNMPQFFNTNFIDSTFVGKSIDMNYGSFFIYNSTRKKKIIVAYRYFDLIQLYDDEGKLLQECCFSKIQKPLLSTVASGMAPEASFYNLSTCGTNKYCYILRANKTGIQLQNQPQKLSGQLIVMDWSGNIKNIYPCPELLYSICVDANDTYLFATIDNYNDLEYSFIRKYKL